ncbi:MAG: PDZ domain-containing protein [candidate division Zixibacteria bacterium]|nr:PDZ domain-containing protein [candidate division Zixibacteria bacterium]
MRKSVMLALGLLLAVLIVGSAVGGSHRSEEGAWLGVGNQSVDYDLIEEHDLSVKYGAYIHWVEDDSPADEAGLQEGDVIVALGGEKITDSDDLSEALIEFDEGDEVSLEVVRADEKLKLKATLDEKSRRKRVHVIMRDADEYSFKGSGSFIGVKLQTLNKQLGEFFGVEKGRGALIQEVEEDSPAEKAGLKAGDVIVAIDDEKVRDVDDVIEIIGDTDAGDKVEIAVLRNRKEATFEVEVEERDNFGGLDYRYMIGLPNVPDIGDIDIKVPKMRGLFHGDFSDDELIFEQEEFEHEMKRLRKDLEELREELKEIRLKLD